MQIYDNKEIHQYHQVDICRYCVIIMALLRLLNHVDDIEPACVLTIKLCIQFDFSF